MKCKFTTLILTLALSLLAAPLAEAQQAGKVPRVGLLMTRSPSDPVDAQRLGAFRQGLGELGWVEGQNIAIEYRGAEGKYDRFPHLAAELVRLRVDVIVAAVTSAALAAKNATRTIPIVFVQVADPVESGLVASLARPGGNLTGLSWLGRELSAKQLDLLKEAVPKVSRVAVLLNPANQSHPVMLREVEGAARALGVQLQPLEVRDPGEFSSAFAAMTREQTGGLLIPGDGMFVLHRTRIADLATKNRLSSVSALREHAEAGSLMAYGVNRDALFRRAATFVDKILKGAKPADLPVEQPTRFELVINLKTAKALGLAIPSSVLLRADHVIE